MFEQNTYSYSRTNYLDTYLRTMFFYLVADFSGLKSPQMTFNSFISGLYEINEELNSKYVFAEIEMARSLLNMDRTLVSALELKLKADADEDQVRDNLESIFEGNVLIKNRIQQNDALYKMLNTENIAVYLIFTLVLIIALFNVIGSIISF